MQVMQGKQCIQSLKAYQPGKPIEEVKREYGLSHVVKLASNENPYGCSPDVWALLALERGNLHLYPEGTAPLLLEQLSLYHQIATDQLVLGNGSDEIVHFLARAYLEPGVSSVMADFTFPRYEAVSMIAGANVRKVPLKEGVHDLAAFSAAITGDTRIVWLCNPNNPTGTMFTHDELVCFLDHIPAHILVVVDEAYAEYVVHVDYPRTVSLLAKYTQLVILRTFSKIFGLAALRVGYGIANPLVIEQLNRVREPFNINRLAQRAAVAALADTTFTEQCGRRNRDLLERFTLKLQEYNLPYFPSQTNFLLFSTGACDQELFSFMLARGIIVRPGSALGYPGYVRLTIGNAEEMQYFQECFSLFLEEKSG